MQGNHINITSQRPTRKETKSKMDKQIRNDLNGLKGEFKKTMLDGMPKMHNMKTVKLTNKELTLQIDNGKEMPFYAL